MGSNPRVEDPYDLSPTHTVMLGVDFELGFGDGGWEHTPNAPEAVACFREAATRWRSAGGRVIMCREIYYPSDFLGADGEPIEEVVANNPFMSGRDNTEFYPGLVEPEDLVMRKTGFSAVGDGNLLEILAEHGWDTVVMGGLTTPICVGTTSDDLSMAAIKVVILEDASASRPIEGFSAEEAHGPNPQREKVAFTAIDEAEGVTVRVPRASENRPAALHRRRHGEDPHRQAPRELDARDRVRLVIIGYRAGLFE